MVLIALICFIASFRQMRADWSCKDHHSIHGFALVDHVYKSFTADRLAVCYSACNTQPPCQSLNYDLVNKICQFNNDTKYFRAKYFVEKATSVYADNPDSEVPWRMLNLDPVCFGAKDDQYGRFQIDVGGSFVEVKLVHVSGSVSCRAGDFSRWGCETSNTIHTLLTTNDVVVLPESGQKFYQLPGYNSNSKEIVFTGLSKPLFLTSGQELRLWYSEDFVNNWESDNAGMTCANVLAKYM